MSKIAKNVLFLGVALVLAFACGNASGLYFYPRLFGAAEADADGHDHGNDQAHDDHGHDDHGEEGVLALTKQAHDNLGLKMGTPTLGEYWKSRTVPGEIIEIPGKSDLSVSAPVDGVIEEVFIRAGQGLGARDRLVTVRITDDSLINLQSKLLATIARLEVVRTEIERLAPLIVSGSVSGKRKRELEYELRQLENDQATRLQEIRARGLPEADLQSVINEKSLASKLTIVVPKISDESYVAAHDTAFVSATKPVGEYSIENLWVHPGKSIRRGDDICSLAYHAELYIQGHAFDDDLKLLENVASNNWSLNAEFGHAQSINHSNLQHREGLKLLYVDNHVDLKTQTFKFYLPLKNEIAQLISDGAGRSFQQWKFKPGQRVHLNLPVERWENQVTVPIEALVVDGPNAFVFAEHIVKWHERKPHDYADGDHDDHEEAFIELEPIPVRLLHRDNRMAVIENDGQLSLDGRIALNNAYNLHLAIKTQASGGGGGHDHGHDH